MSWAQGRDQISAALNAGDLQHVTGGQTAGEGWISDARRKYATAQAIADADPETAYVTTYDAARFALVGLLAQQGLRATQKGGHYAVEQAYASNSAAGSHHLEPCVAVAPNSNTQSYPGEEVEHDELIEALAAALQIIDRAAQLIGHLSIFIDA